MKILMLVDSLKVGGGSDKAAAVLGSELQEKGFDVTFLTLSDENPKYKFKGNYHTIHENDIYGDNFKRILKLLKYAPKVKNLCKELDIDIIISTGDPANFHALISRWLYGNKVKLIISQHINPEIFLGSKLKSSLIRFFYPRADKTVCVSKEIEKILNQKYGVMNTHTIYNIMDVDENIRLSCKELPETNSELFEDEKSFNFINIGRLNHQKGQWFLIRSFRKLVDRFKNARLYILGEGDLRGCLEELINDLNLKENVHLLGEQENIFPFLANSDCFILSSLWEGLPMALIEAMSLNIPIISTDCKTGPREILCPELDLNEAISYPYLGKYAVLSLPLPNEEVFQDLNTVPLIESEEQLVELMAKMIDDQQFRKNYSHGQKVAGNFDKYDVLIQWRELLKKISV